MPPLRVPSDSRPTSPQSHHRQERRLECGFMDEQSAALAGLNQSMARSGVSTVDELPARRVPHDQPKGVSAVVHRYRLPPNQACIT